MRKALKEARGGGDSQKDAIRPADETDKRLTGTIISGEEYLYDSLCQILCVFCILKC